MSFGDSVNQFVCACVLVGTNRFEAMSGLKINLNKSEITPIGPVTNTKDLASKLGCKIGSLPTSYLGLPLGSKHKALGVWDSV